MRCVHEFFFRLSTQARARELPASHHSAEKFDSLKLPGDPVAKKSASQLFGALVVHDCSSGSNWHLTAMRT